MTSKEATAEVFLTALRSLSSKDRQAVLARIAEDEDLRQDLHDLALLAERRNEPSRAFRDYLAEKSG